MQLIVVTGLSGSGKSIALRQLEDLGYYCIDNLPGNYLVPVAEHLHSVGRDLLAVSFGFPQRRFHSGDFEKASKH